MTTLEDMSGEKATGSSPKLALNEIRINGNKGKFLYKNVLGGRKADDKGIEKYEETEIGDSVDLVFLKIRRKLSQYKKGGNSLNTNEHNSKQDFITLFGAEGGVKRGIASELREAYQGLRTIQVVYALYKEELVRVIVKGSSLGSDSKPENVLDFYSYISSFKKGERKDHFYECMTKLVATKEEGEQGEYYSMTFLEGAKLDDEAMKVVTEKMTTAFNYAKELDAYVISKKEAGTVVKTIGSDATDGVDTIEYPEEDNTVDDVDVDPKDIPF